jgi:hypothetical protein
MVSFKSIADKAKGVFKKPEAGQETEKKPGDLLEDIKRYEEKISKKDFSGDSGAGELKEEVDAGTISKESYAEVMQALDIKDEGVKTGPMPVARPETPQKTAEPAPKPAPKAAESAPKKPAGVVVEPKKEEMPSERIMRAMGGEEDKFDRIISLLEEIKDSLGKKRTAKEGPKKRPAKKKAKKPVKKARKK